MPPALPALHQQRFNDDEVKDEYSMILSQARSVGGGPPTRNITFSLGQNTAQPPPSVTQPEPHYEDIMGGNNAAATQPQSGQVGPQGEIANMRAPETGVGAASYRNHDILRVQ